MYIYKELINYFIYTGGIYCVICIKAAIIIVNKLLRTIVTKQFHF